MRENEANYNYAIGWCALDSHPVVVVFHDLSTWHYCCINLLITDDLNVDMQETRYDILPAILPIAKTIYEYFVCTGICLFSCLVRMVRCESSHKNAYVRQYNST